MKEKLKIGIVGLGSRGKNLMRNVILQMDDIEVTALCEPRTDKLNEAADYAEQERGVRPLLFEKYTDLLNVSEIDTVLITSSWYSHVSVAIDAMLAGKSVGSEVGCADTLAQCYELLRVHEQTKMPCTMLENCCYGRTELMILNMVRQGVFGEIVHVSGGYHHDLREGMVKRHPEHYRLQYYMERNGDNYPTHELGPLAVLLKLGRGNRMMTLSSFSSKSAGLSDYIKRSRPQDEPLQQAAFRQGDIVTTVITCANGETMVLTLDTTLPRAYSRGFAVRGTKGMYEEDNNSIFLDGQHDHKEPLSAFWNNADSFRDEYEHPIWREFLNDGVRGGHGGMDWLVLRRFFDAIKEGRPTPLDTYDMASWLSVFPLSEMSIARGGAPVDVPDFTNGRWMHNKEDWEL